MRGLAKWCFTHRWKVLLAWLCLFLCLTAAKSLAGTSYSNDLSLPNTPSYRAMTLLQRSAARLSGDTEQIVMAVSRGRVDGPDVRARVERMLGAVGALPHVGAVSSPFSPAGAGQLSRSGRVAFAYVTFDRPTQQLSTREAKTLVATARAASGRGLEIGVSGPLAEETLQTGSSGVGVGFLASGVVLFLVFGSLLATALPLLSTALALGSGVALVGLLSHVVKLNSSTSQVALLIGLGVGVDYALFIVTRYRQGLRRGLSEVEAVMEAVDTSGRAVLFAGITVCIALLGMMALGISFLYGVAVGASITVGLTVLAALTFMPALLGFFGVRVLRRRDRAAARAGVWRADDESRAWTRWAARLAERPAVFAVAAIAVLGALALPFTAMRLASSDAGSDPAGATTRVAYDLLAEGFGPGYSGPLQLVAQVSGRAQQSAFDRIDRAVAATPGVAGAQTAVYFPGHDSAPGVALADIYPDGSPQAASTTALVQTVRDGVIPRASRGTGINVLVGGETAQSVDFSKAIADKLPFFVGVVVLLSFLLLMAVFRSLVIPLVAVIMNLFSIAASFGIVTAIFSDGIGTSLLGIHKAGPIDPWIPLAMFAILFGLSMDYEVFLVSRISEEWRRRRDNRTAVTRGLAATGGTITAAAAIMMLVFGAFVLGGLRTSDLFGVGMASAVLVDALIVRSVLVPALMLLAGPANWKLPAAVGALMPGLRVKRVKGPGTRTSADSLA